VTYQESLGPRLPGSDAHAVAVDWISAQAREAGWEVDIQETERMGHPVRNIIAKRGSGAPWIILGAHYDSRMAADQDDDPAKHDQPVPGANDGASGVAVLLELARTLPQNHTGQTWLVFFDTEDQGSLPGWDWILGSRAFAESLTSAPDAVVIVDMIGDANLNIYKERNSDPALTDLIWQHAAEAGYAAQFIPQYKFSMLDDHTPFLERGYRAIDIIDFDYPHWHTTADTADKVSPESLKAIGDTLLRWLGSENPIPGS
jgi:Zn-dependent M28 family amino/carboxypeptidase